MGGRVASSGACSASGEAACEQCAEQMRGIASVPLIALRSELAQTNIANIQTNIDRIKKYIEAMQRVLLKNSISE